MAVTPPQPVEPKTPHAAHPLIDTLSVEDMLAVREHSRILAAAHVVKAYGTHASVSDFGVGRNGEQKDVHRPRKLGVCSDESETCQACGAGEP
jgi:hypothetical protein